MRPAVSLLFGLLALGSLQARNYSNEIVASMTQGDEKQAVELTREALNAGGNATYIFEAVKTESIKHEQTNLYLDYLLALKAAKPEVTGNIDEYLLDYYAFRDNPAMMITTANALLKRHPDNVKYLTILSQGWLKAGDIERCIDVNKRILTFEPKNFEAILYLANYYYDRWEKGDRQALDPARDFVARALKLKATPRLNEMSARLNAPRK